MSDGRAPTRQVRTAVVGLGWAARSIWLPRLRAHPGFVVTAVVDPDPRAHSGADDGGVIRYADAGELRPEVAELAIVAVPNHLHAPVGSLLLERGISVFVEKPVCVNTGEADRLAAAERDGGALLLAGSAARHRADVRALAALVPSLGQIRHVDLAWVRARGVPDGDGWFTRRGLSGGGALVDLGWHLLDLLPPLVGAAGFREVVGTVSGDHVNDRTARAAWRAEDDEVGSAPPSDVEDTARGFLITDEGISVSLRAAWRSHEPLDATVVTVEGSGGTATLRCTFGFSPHRAGGSVLTVTRDGETTPVAVAEEAIGAEYGTQLDVIAAELGDPTTQGRAVGEARRTIGAIERLYASARPLPRAERPVPPDPRASALRAVVFDLDGVLVDSTEVMREAFRVAYAEAVGEGEAPFAEYNKHLGRYFPDIMRIMGLPLAMEEPFVRESYRLAHQVPMFEGVPELLAELRARGLRLAVATGKSGPRARSLLDLLGVLPLFDHVIGSDEVANPKPAPDIVELALDRLGVSPDEAVMVGDAVTDLASARGAGVRAVAALWGECEAAALLAARPDVALDSPAELLALCPPLRAPALEG
ncbi:hypothetical protein C1701_25880 [Actinoalloteichus sp. AHMU CJ021]|uniref:3-amino-5-hydroxybenoic acid synthesis related protein n=1 Tax=Actinoalloteichus caeruleus DSM 43889 TaxID=1120930 RepID=A0ABT1JDQ3_ACTCY|nr:hypothetical protein C1701_25880 [Actinoalloteichus sp. AHMU CJ021]MCP2330622.1 3-amino-5-hydroxybenoic acid synthesis related protein [Actinoalloteichus caeruleus DSM 43889]